MGLRGTRTLIVLISGRGSNMLALAKACAEGRIPAKLAAVISDDPQAPGLKRARERGIRTEVVDYKAYPGREPFERALLAACRAHRPDLVALAGFMRVLSGGFVKPLMGRIVNVHPSLLPEHTGLNTHRRVIEAGDKRHGCSIHYVTEALDAGPLIAQEVFDVRDDDTAETLAERTMAREHMLYPYVAKLICERRVTMKGDTCQLDGDDLTEPLSLPS